MQTDKPRRRLRVALRVPSSAQPRIRSQALAGSAESPGNRLGVRRRHHGRDPSREHLDSQRQPVRTAQQPLGAVNHDAHRRFGSYLHGLSPRFGPQTTDRAPPNGRPLPHERSRLGTYHIDDRSRSESGKLSKKSQKVVSHSNAG